MAIRGACPTLGVLPPPLVGEGWGGGWLLLDEMRPNTSTPTPNPSPQGATRGRGAHRICRAALNQTQTTVTLEIAALGRDCRCRGDAIRVERNDRDSGPRGSAGEPMARSARAGAARSCDERAGVRRPVADRHAGRAAGLRGIRADRDRIACCR